MNAYDSTFFDSIAKTANDSADAVVPLVVQLLNPTSVVDFGCGEGVWLNAFRRHGVADVFGVDGDYVDRAKLLIPRETFVSADLERPVTVGRNFDLAISLEVAEHLKPSAGEQFVRTLTEHSNTVLFSAAVPGQGGTRHINEQWTPYWESLFEERGFRRIDSIRPLIWNNKQVAWWYRQNMLLFASDAAIAKCQALADAYRAYGSTDMEFVHRRVIMKHGSFLSLCRRTATAFTHAVRRRLRPSSQVE